VLNKKSFLYETTKNPLVIAQFGLDQLNPDFVKDKVRAPQRVIESAEFENYVRKVYTG